MSDSDKPKKKMGRPATGLTGVKVNFYLAQHAARLLELEAGRRSTAQGVKVSKKDVIEDLIYKHINPAD